MSNESNTCLIDWGSSNFRAWVINPNGQLIEEISTPVGILSNSVESKSEWINDKLIEISSDFINLKFFAVGMLGSANGVVEIPFLQTPVTAQEWISKSAKYVSLNETQITILTGIATNNKDPLNVDIMRGEEFQVFTSDSFESENAKKYFVCPGTHSKWITVEYGQITNFKTFATGELFNILSKYSSFSSFITDELTDSGFDYGVNTINQPGGLMYSVFNLRAAFLNGLITRADLRSALSGMLIANEITSALSTNTDFEKIVLIGEKKLCATYKRIMSILGVNSDIDETKVNARVTKLSHMISSSTAKVGI